MTEQDTTNRVTRHVTRGRITIAVGIVALMGLFIAGYIVKNKKGSSE